MLILAKKGKHTCPELAGVKNMKNEVLDKMTERKKQNVGSTTQVSNRKILDLRKLRQEQLKRDRIPGTTKWTEESLRETINQFLDWCYGESVLPSKPLLAIWLNCHTDTLRTWIRADDFRSDVLKETYTLMEAMYFNDLDSHTVSNMFRLKTNHGYVEASRLDLNSNVVQQEVNIKDTISNLGLSTLNDKSNDK